MRYKLKSPPIDAWQWTKVNLSKGDCPDWVEKLFELPEDEGGIRLQTSRCTPKGPPCIQAPMDHCMGWMHPGDWLIRDQNYSLVTIDAQSFEDAYQPIGT